MTVIYPSIEHRATVTSKGPGLRGYRVQWRGALITTPAGVHRTFTEPAAHKYIHKRLGLEHGSAWKVAYDLRAGAQTEGSSEAGESEAQGGVLTVPQRPRLDGKQGGIAAHSPMVIAHSTKELTLSTGTQRAVISLEAGQGMSVELSLAGAERPYWSGTLQALGQIAKGSRHALTVREWAGLTPMAVGTYLGQ